ncbi:MAG: HEAT repeat domain-containing protein [Verrucomicrobia bacterium]|nr:HEAT repeat domain-containing protein [Verrucomicrobiota bacterium]
MTSRYFSMARWAWSLAAMWAMASGSAGLGAAESAVSAREKERQLIQILKSDAAPADKAIPCKQLAIYGTREAVPALAPLLADPELASWARIALEAIPDPAAGAALRDALGRVRGRLLIGAINSIGVRRDAGAVDPLIEKLRDPDAGIAAAAAEALGRIGGPTAAGAIESSLAAEAPQVRAAAAQGCILAAERFLAENKRDEAQRLYDAVRRSNVPLQRTLEATRGAILVRQSAGIPLLIEQLRSSDRARYAMALRTARELPGTEATEAIASELDRCPAARQASLFMALSDRPDAAVLPAVLRIAQSGPKELRVIALRRLDHWSDVACVPVLLEAAAGNDDALAQAARTALTRIEGPEIERDLLARLSSAGGRTRQVLIELAGPRQMTAALPIIRRSVSDSDAKIRRAAVETIGALGDRGHVADLVRLLDQTAGAAEQESIQKALLSICGRAGAGSVPSLMPLMRSREGALRQVALQGMAAAGGAEALAAVVSGLEDADEAVQDEAVGVLGTWPNNWPEDQGALEPLLALAKTGRKMSHRVQGARGYLQLLQENKGIAADARLARVDALLPSIPRAEEKRLAIAVVGAIPTAAALDRLAILSEDPAVKEEACLAIVNLVGGKQRPNIAPERIQKALRTVLERTANDTTRQKAQALLQAR